MRGAKGPFTAHENILFRYTGTNDTVNRLIKCYIFYVY